MKALSRFSKLAALVLVLFLASTGIQAADQIFDHSTTGFDLLGAHSMSACENCHTGGLFAGTPRRCEGCHSRNGRISGTPKPPNHIMATDQCENCHQEVAWQGVVLVDHTQVLGDCLQCHNNTIVPGQPFNHFPTNNRQCRECHSDLAWQPAHFTHDIPAPCVSCHNGSYNVEGQPPNHILVVKQCDACHTNSLSWAPVLKVDHDFVLGTCYSCHGPGGVAKGQFIGHIPTGTRECSECHTSTETFAF